MPMSDHQDSENFTYDRSWGEIEHMLDMAEREQNKHYSLMQRTKVKKERIFHMRNYKALQGVINALRWTLGDMHVDAEEVLGRD